MDFLNRCPLHDGAVPGPGRREQLPPIRVDRRPERARSLLHIEYRLGGTELLCIGYIAKMILFSLGILAVFSVAYWFFMRRNFVGPLMRIRKNVTEFAQNSTATTTRLEDIRTKDEIQDLAESIRLMEDDSFGDSRAADSGEETPSAY